MQLIDKEGGQRMVIIAKIILAPSTRQEDWFAILTIRLPFCLHLFIS